MSPEDALVVAEVMRRLTDLMASLPLRADAYINNSFTFVKGDT